MQRESVWLQKALFALRKAEVARQKLADTREEEIPDYALARGNTALPLSELEEALEAEIETLMRDVREVRRSLV